MENVRRRVVVLGGIAFATATWARAQKGLTRSCAVVMVVASIHKRLATSTSFTYDDLYASVARFKPDYVGVEIRQEDLGRDDMYLGRNYPAEMVHLAHAYGSRCFGFDWLGDDLAGRVIPADWWKVQSPVKALERDLNNAPPLQDAAHMRLSDRLDRLSDEQDRILASATVTSLVDGRYDRVTAAYYRTLTELLAGTRFAALPAYYRRRDHAIAANIVTFAADHPGRRIAVVTGGDHHGPIMTALRARRSAIEPAGVS